MIVEGIYEGMTDAEYHGDPVKGGSLSNSGAKTLLKSPALYRWQLDHRVEKREFDVGHAVHGKVLGVGMDVVAIPDDVLSAAGAANTKAAREFIAAAREAGQVPLKADVIAQVDAMSDAVLTHPLARALFERAGVAESSIFSPDPETGEWMRARPDFLPERSDGRTIIVDLKTAASADPREFDRSAAEYGYDMQSEFYPELVRRVRGDDDTAFVFVVVEKTAPYLVSVVELDEQFSQIGRAKVRRAVDTFHQCRQADEWPGYAPVVHKVEPARWYVIKSEEEQYAS